MNKKNKFKKTKSYKGELVEVKQSNLMDSEYKIGKYYKYNIKIEENNERKDFFINIPEKYQTSFPHKIGEKITFRAYESGKIEAKSLWKSIDIVNENEKDVLDFLSKIDNMVKENKKNKIASKI